MKELISIIIVVISTMGCGVNGQSNRLKVVVDDGILISVDDIVVGKYGLEVKYLDFDVNDITYEHLLCVTTTECDFALTEKLLNKGANPNYKCEEGLDHVITNIGLCEKNSLKLAKLLLQHGANINGADDDNDSFLSYSTGYGKTELVKYLLENGADINQRDVNPNMGCLPIHSIASIAELRLYIEHNANLEEQCDNGRNLFHFVARENYIELAKYLLENKIVNSQKLDKNGESPFDYAKKRNNIEMMKLLEK